MLRDPNSNSGVAVLKYGTNRGSCRTTERYACEVEVAGMGGVLTILNVVLRRSLTLDPCGTEHAWFRRIRLVVYHQAPSTVTFVWRVVCTRSR